MSATQAPHFCDKGCGCPWTGTMADPFLGVGPPTNDRPWPWEPVWRAPKALWGRTFPFSLDGHAQIVEALFGSRHTRRLTAQRAAGRRGREGGRPHPRCGDEHE